jgi:hypothetical protein
MVIGYVSSEYTTNNVRLPRVGQYNVFLDDFERIVLSQFSVRKFIQSKLVCDDDFFRIFKRHVYVSSMK